MKFSLKDTCVGSFALLIYLMILPSVVWATDLQKNIRLNISGYAWTKGSADLERDSKYEDFYESRSGLRIKTKTSYKELFELIISVDGKYEFYKNNKTDSVFVGRLFESYFACYLSKLDIRVGKQIVRWGKCDEISPVDNVNPQNFEEFFLNTLEERKIPIWMVKTNFYPSDNWNIELLFIPFFRHNDIRFFNRDWAIFDHIKEATKDSHLSEAAKTLIQKTNIIYDNPARNIRNSEFGTRISGTLGRFDVAFDYLYFWNRSPILKSQWFQKDFSIYSTKGFDGYLEELNWSDIKDPAIYAGFYRQHMFGMEIETTIEDFGFRAEACVLKNIRFLTKDFHVARHDTIIYALGVDYLTSTDTYFNLQFSHQIILNYKPIIFLEHMTYSLYGRINQDFLRGKLSTGIRFFYNLTDKSTYLNPSIKLHFIDNFTVTTGFNLIYGDRDTLFGGFRNNDEIYVLVRYDF